MSMKFGLLYIEPVQIYVHVVVINRCAAVAVVEDHVRYVHVPLLYGPNRQKEKKILTRQADTFTHSHITCICRGLIETCYCNMLPSMNTAA